MAIKPCRECKKPVSTTAPTCPSCGTSKPTRSRGRSIFFAVAAGFIGVWIVNDALMDQQARPQAEREPMSREEILTSRACSFSITAVRAQLIAPKTAEFPSCAWNRSEFGFRSSKDLKTWWVSGYVDASNRMGAVLRQRYIVKMALTDGDRFEAVEVTLGD